MPRRPRPRGGPSLWLLSLGQARESDRPPGTAVEPHMDVSRFSRQRGRSEQELDSGLRRNDEAKDQKLDPGFRRITHQGARPEPHSARIRTESKTSAPRKAPPPLPIRRKVTKSAIIES